MVIRNDVEITLNCRLMLTTRPTYVHLRGLHLNSLHAVNGALAAGTVYRMTVSHTL